ncbi:MAG: hypothetical protein LBS73_04050 [Campylobacteraceae bacterium]|jgi:hypothetical protein|nr:hypothetical protein [Campylobacteraceae bacterium]
MIQVERTTKFKEKRVDTGEDYIPTKEDLTFRETDTKKRIIETLTDDIEIQDYIDMVLEDGTEATIQRAFTYIAEAKNIKPTEANINKLKAQFLPKVH